MYFKGGAPSRCSANVTLLFSGCRSILSHLPTRNVRDLGLLSLLHSKSPHYCDFTHLSPRLSFISMKSSPAPSPSQCPWQQRHISSLGPNRAEMRAATGQRPHEDPRQAPLPLSALRPDMKGLFREMQRIVIRAFLLLIMILPEPKERKKNYKVCCAIHYNTWASVYI